MATKRRIQTKRRPAAKRRPERLLFYYPLILPGDRKDLRRQQFLRSYIQLENWILAVREQEFKERFAALRKRESAAKRKHAATVAAVEILRETTEQLDHPSFDAEKFRQRLGATGLSREELLAMFDHWESAARQVEDGDTNEQVVTANDAKELRAARRNTRRELKHLGDENAIVEACHRLFDAAVKKKDEGAAKALQAAAGISCGLLSFLEQQKPELLRPIARLSQQWPVLTSLDPTDRDRVKAKLERLEFGADTIHARFRAERVFRESTPARAYARSLVETIWTNRLLIPSLSARLRAMQIMDAGCTTDFEDIPLWLRSIASLPNFGTSTAPLWAKAAREILRAECPDFHTRAEWSSVRRAFQAHEKGRIQNKILDKISSAMQTIARSDAGETLAQKSLPNSGNRLRIRQSHKARAT